MLHAFATLVLAISVAGCVTDQVSRRPLGIQEQDWTSMTPEQRLQAHFKQVEVNQAERKQKKQETAPAESRKADVRPGGSFGVAYGDRIQCIGAPLSLPPISVAIRLATIGPSLVPPHLRAIDPSTRRPE